MVLTDISPSEYEILLDGVFWICYARTLSLSTVNKGRPFIVVRSFLAFIYHTQHVIVV